MYSYIQQISTRYLLWFAYNTQVNTYDRYISYVMVLLKSLQIWLQFKDRI